MHHSLIYLVTLVLVSHHACRHTPPVQQMQANPRRAQELYLTLAVQRAAAELCDFDEARDVRRLMNNYVQWTQRQRTTADANTGSIHGLYGTVADVVMIPDQAIAAAVSRRRQIVSQIIIDRREVAYSIEPVSQVGCSMLYTDVIQAENILKKYLILDTLPKNLKVLTHISASHLNTGAVHT
jgi:hypothetical protein